MTVSGKLDEALTWELLAARDAELAKPPGEADSYFINQLEVLVHGWGSRPECGRTIGAAGLTVRCGYPKAHLGQHCGSVSVAGDAAWLSVPPSITVYWEDPPE